MSKKQLYLIDATAFCYRAFYALKGLSTSSGFPTNAIYGFVSMLQKLLRDEKPEYLAICFDVSRDTFRQKKYAEYKIHRPPMPDGLSGQMPLIKQIISAYGINIFEKEGFEADDIIATLSKKAKKESFSTVIVSSDKDILQLVDDKTTVFSPYKDEGVVYDKNKVKERFGVEPKKIADIIALMGDGVDNIPGVSGIGEKTAVSLIGHFGSLEELIDKADKIKQDKIRKLILQNTDKIKLSRELAILDEDMDIEFDLNKLILGEPNLKELFKLFKQLEFKKFLSEFPEVKDNLGDIRHTRIEEEKLKGLLDKKSELVLFGEDLNNFTFNIDNKLFQVDNPGKILKAILEDSRIKKIGHDLKKLKVSLAKDDIELNGLYFDTMIAAYLINPSNRQYDLPGLCFDYLGLLIGDKDIKHEKTAELIARLKPKLDEALKERSLFKLFQDLEMPLVEVLAQMELNGISLDSKTLKQISKALEVKLINLIEKIYDISGCQFNINSPKQLREILFVKLKLPVVKRSKTGPSTDEEVLRNLANEHRLPALLLEYRQLMKIKSTYVDTLPDLVNPKTGKIHTSFNQTGTETGRLSSSNPNLQNIPIKTDAGKSIRRAIVASLDSNYILSFDYSQIELRILTYLCKDKNLISAFKNNKDIHRSTASLIYGMEEKDITEDMRDVAKRVNFGIIYGLTSYGLSRDLGISLDEAQSFIDTYFSRYPRVKEYIQTQIDKAKKEGYVSTILGRRRYIPEINDKNRAIQEFAKRKAINTPVQGSASDLIKLAMVQIYNQMRKRNLEAKMILQIHDELVFDVPSKELPELIELARDRMENVLKLDVPIKVDIKKGKNWLEMEKIK